ncbi:hypothetical protein B6D29_02810 [Microgenomates bacterium UTCPR1]|nr:MAG: hypothetical protein B6D29_02810 [Microgenomates bacterium UTCPR1]
MRRYNYESVDKPLSDYYKEIASRTKWNRENAPTIVFAIGTARTGTTASLNVFRGSIVEDAEGKLHDIPVAYQHFKAGLRHAMLGWGENPDWSFQIPEVPLFYMKDTIGPYTDKESRYNPLKVFEEMGYPMDKIFPVFFYRDPLDSFASWIDKWSSILPRETLVENFITASNTLRDIKRDLEAKGIPHGTFLYETIRDNRPSDSAEALFDQINQTIAQRERKKLIATENTTENWDKLDQKDWHPDQPKAYEIPRIDKCVHHDAKTKTSWEFKVKTPEKLAEMITPDEVKRLEEAGIPQIYDKFRLDAQRTLRLSVAESISFRGIKEVFAKKSAEGQRIQTKR